MASQITGVSIVYSAVFFQAQIKEDIKAPRRRVTGLCERKSPVTDEFPTQRASNAENVSIMVGVNHITQHMLQTLNSMYVFLSVLHKNDDKLITDNYRPVSLLSSVSKLSKKLYSYFTTNDTC